MATGELIRNVPVTRKITLVTADKFYTRQFIVEEGYQCIVGRSDTQSAFYPTVDLTELGGYRMGVSRNHATLELVDGTLYITDQSSNGTHINGEKMTKGQRLPLDNHSKVQFGELNFHIYVQQ